MQYEIEERINKNLKERLPAEAKLKRTISHICDTYFSFPNPMIRVRYGEILFPISKKVASICMKKIDGERNIKEFETPVGDSKCAKEIFFSLMGEPKVIVKGKREEYVFEKATICFDYIEGLGDWTEVEVMANSLEEKAEALEQVRKVFDILGVSKEELTDKTYPEMLYLTVKK